MALKRYSQLDEWAMIDEDKDLRGRDVLDPNGDHVGTIDDMIVDTDTEAVRSVILDNGHRYSTNDLTIEDQVVYLNQPVPPGDTDEDVYRRGGAGSTPPAP